MVEWLSAWFDGALGRMGGSTRVFWEGSGMPPKSEAQRRAMEAAAHGHSTLGIPASVGKEFSAADKGGKLPEHSKGRHELLKEHHPDHPGSRK